jgi:hypothetical protein
MAQYKNKDSHSVIEELITEPSSVVEEIQSETKIETAPIFKGYKWELTAGSHTQADGTVINRGDSFYHEASTNAELPFWAKNRARLASGLIITG